MTDGDAASTVEVSFFNSGSVQVLNGVAQFTSEVDNSGKFQVDNGNSLKIGGRFDNAEGSIEALDGSTVTYQAAATTADNVNGVLGGTYAATDSAISINGAAITDNMGDITLSGANSLFQTRQGTSDLFTLLEDSLRSTGVDAALRILGNRDYTTENDYTNVGLLELGGGTFAPTAS